MIYQHIQVYMYQKTGPSLFRWWLVTFLVPSHYLNQCWLFRQLDSKELSLVKFRFRFKIFIEINAFENVVCKIMAILSHPQKSNYLNYWWLFYWCIYASPGLKELTHPPLVPHIFDDKLAQHWFRFASPGLKACSVPGHYLRQCSLIVNWTPRNRLWWNSNWNTKLFNHENAFENVVYEMVAILSRGDELISLSRRWDVWLVSPLPRLLLLMSVSRLFQRLPEGFDIVCSARRQDFSEPLFLCTPSAKLSWDILHIKLHKVWSGP